MALSACGGGGESTTQGTAQTITFASPGDQTFGTAPAALVATATSNLTVAFASATPAVCTASGTALALAAAGTCTVTASQAGNSTFAAAAAVSNSFTVAPSAQTISFISPGNQALGTAPAALVATATSGLAVSFAATTAAVCTVSGSTLTLVGAGTCVVDATQAGNGNYVAATAVSQSFAVSAAPMAAQTITFVSPGDQVLGTTPAALSATSSSGLTVAFSSATPSVCTVSGTTLALASVGTCTVRASQAGDANYAAAAVVSNSFDIAPTAQSITFTSPGNLSFGSAAPALVATASSGLTVSFASTTTSVCTVSGSALTLAGAGTCTLSASQAGNSSFAAATPVSQTFTVAPGAQTISFPSPGNQTLGTAPPALVATSTSGLAVSFAATTPLVCTTSGSTLTLVGAGSCSVSASQAGNANYAAATPVTNLFAVSLAPLTPQTITFAALADQTLGSAAPALAATATSGLAVAFASTTPGTCTVNGTTLTLAAVGACTVVASQAGNGTYSAAPLVPNSFLIAAPPLTAQTITFASPGNQTLGTAPPALVATSTSGLPVAFASSTLGICTVSGTSLTLVAVGTCTVSASQAGNATFAAAAVVPNSFSVAAAPLGAELMANGGFETAAVLPGQFALGWRGVNGRPATLANDARTGLRSASLAIPDPGFNGSGLVQNAVDDGGLPSILGLHVGKTTVLTFWAKGNASVTGNVNFSLRYLDGVGNILNPVVNTNFGSRINPNTWTQITLNGPAIPANTSAVFLEMTLAVGPTGVQPPGNCGVDPITGLPLPCDNGQARILIDDVSVRVGP
jgi:hypothetical protein